MSSHEAQKQIDAVLDAALDDLDNEDEDDDDDDVEVQDHTHHKASGPLHSGSRQSGGPKLETQRPKPSQKNIASDNGIDEMMKQFLQMSEGVDGSDDADEFMGRFLQEMQSQIDGELENLERTKKSSEEEYANKHNSSKEPSPSKKNDKQSPRQTASAQNEDNVNQAIASLIEGMSKQANINDDDLREGDNFSGEDDMLRNLMGQIGEGFGDDANADALIDGMMEQLLSKDLMYEPMKKVTEKFPEWLDKNEGKIPEAEYQQ